MRRGGAVGPITSAKPLTFESTAARSEAVTDASRESAGPGFRHATAPPLPVCSLTDAGSLSFTPREENKGCVFLELQTPQKNITETLIIGETVCLMCLFLFHAPVSVYLLTIHICYTVHRRTRKTCSRTVCTRTRKKILNCDSFSLFHPSFMSKC